MIKVEQCFFFFQVFGKFRALSLCKTPVVASLVLGSDLYGNSDVRTPGLRAALVSVVHRMAYCWSTTLCTSLHAGLPCVNTTIVGTQAYSCADNLACCRDFYTSMKVHLALCAVQKAVC